MYLPARIALVDLKVAYESEPIDQPIRMCFSARSESERVDGQGGRNGSSPDGAGIVHILKFYGFYEVGAYLRATCLLYLLTASS